MLNALFVLLLVSVPSMVFGGDQFYVFKDRGSKENRGCPSGWMGAHKALKFNQDIKPGADGSDTAILIQYDVHKDSETAWSGIYWQIPCGNWGSKRGGVDLTGYTKLTFYAKGEGRIDTFKVGGISGMEYEGDTVDKSIGNIELTQEWKEYEIDLTGEDLSTIIGPFAFSISADANENNVFLYLDEIYFEK